MKTPVSIILVIVSMHAICRPADCSLNTKALSVKAISKIGSNLNAINEKVEKKTIRALDDLQKQEQKLKKNLPPKDNIARKELFPLEDKYKELSIKIKDATATKSLNEYIPQLDIVKTGFKFLDQILLVKLYA